MPRKNRRNGKVRGAGRNFHGVAAREAVAAEQDTRLNRVRNELKDKDRSKDYAEQR